MLCLIYILRNEWNFLCLVFLYIALMKCVLKCYRRHPVEHVVIILKNKLKRLVAHQAYVNKNQYLLEKVGVFTLNVCVLSTTRWANFVKHEKWELGYNNKRTTWCTNDYPVFLWDLKNLFKSNKLVGWLTVKSKNKVPDGSWSSKWKIVWVELSCRI